MKTVGNIDGNAVQIELRGVRGSDGDDNQPAIAFGIDGPDSITTDGETSTTKTLPNGETVTVHHSTGSVSYDDEVVSVDVYDKTIYIG